MRILFDTNVILDVLEKREPFFDDSYGALHKALQMDAECLISSSAVTDLYYMLRKYLQSPEQARRQVEKLSQIFLFADVLGADIHAALNRNMRDFEDAVVDAVAQRSGAECIVTRNIRDFAGASVTVMTPAEFLKKP